MWVKHIAHCLAYVKSSINISYDLGTHLVSTLKTEACPLSLYMLRTCNSKATESRKPFILSLTLSPERVLYARPCADCWDTEMRKL